MGANQQMLMSYKPIPLAWDIGAHEFGASGLTVPAEFDVAGATYYAVAPAGYVYDAAQTTNYSTRKYNTLAAAESGLAASPTTPLVINIIGDWTGFTDTTGVELGFINTSPATTITNYLLVRAIGAARHNGVWSLSNYRLEVASANALTFWTNYVRVDGLLIGHSSISASGQGIIGVINGSGVGELSNCILRGANNATFSEIAISVDAAGTQTFKVWNTIIYGIKLSGTLGIVNVRVAGNTLEMYSCTVLGGNGGVTTVAVGIERIAGTLIVKNCYSNASASSYLGTMTMVTCASSDASGNSGLQSIAPSTATFVNVTPGSEDYRLAAASPLINVGTNTSGDPAPLDFTTDIAGKTR